MQILDGSLVDLPLKVHLKPPVFFDGPVAIENDESGWIFSVSQGFKEFEVMIDFVMWLRLALYSCLSPEILWSIS